MLTHQYDDKKGITERLRKKANFIRQETIRLSSIPKLAHFGSVFSCAEILAVLYYHVLTYDPDNPDWDGRDRFIMKGHVVEGVYPILADLGFFPKEQLEQYTRLESPLGNHPMPEVPGIDFGTGSLGHELSVGVGMALAGNRAPTRKFDVYCLIGDGTLHEGQVWGAAMSAAHFGLGNLTVIIDRNEHCVDGLTEEIMPLEPLTKKWESFGWEVQKVNGHDLKALIDCFSSTSRKKPSVIIAHTILGKGLEFMERNPAWHVGFLGEDDREDALEELKGEETSPL